MTRISPTDSSSFFSIDTNYFSARTANVIKQDENLASLYKRREQGDGNVLHENVESPPGNSDEEVIGIITMKDVMEELEFMFYDSHCRLSSIKMKFMKLARVL